MRYVFSAIVAALSFCSMQAQPVLNPLWSTAMSANKSFWSEDGTKFVTWNQYGATVRESVSGKLIAVSKLLIRSIGHSRYSQHGNMVLFASSDSTAQIWDISTGNVVRVFKGHQCGVNSAAFNKSATRVITGGDDGSCIIWNALTGQMLRRITTNDYYCFSPIFTEREDQILYSTRKHPFLADTSGNVLRTFETNGAITTDIWTGADDKRIFFANTEKCIVADKDSPIPLATIPSPVLCTGASDTLFYTKNYYGFCTYSTLSCTRLSVVESEYICSCGIDVSPDRRLIAMGPTTAADSSIMIFDLASGKQLASLYLNTRQIFNTLSFSPDGKYVLASGQENRTGIWSMESFKTVFEVPKVEERVSWARFSPNGKTVTICTYPNKSNESLFLHDATTGEQLCAFNDLHFQPYQISFSRSSRYLAARCVSATLYVYDIEEKRLVGSFTAPGMPINDILLSNDGSRLAVVTQWSPDGIYDVKTGTIAVHPQTSYSNVKMQWNNDETQILSNFNGYFLLWNSTDGSRLSSNVGYNTTWTGVNKTFFSPDFNTIVAGRGVFNYFDAKTTKWLGQVNQGHSPVLNISMASDSKRVMTCGIDGEIRISDNKASTPRSYSAAGCKVLFAEMSTTGDMVLVTTDSGYTAILDAVSFKELARLKPELSIWTQYSFDKLGARVISLGGYNEAAFIWDLSSIRPVASVPPEHTSSYFSLYPLPADQFLNISWDGPITESLKIDIDNMLGQHIATHQVDVSIKDSSLASVEVSALPPGTYVARLTTPEFSQTRLFVVCH